MSTTPKNILVCCKRVIDYAVKIRVKSDKTGVEKINVKHSMNPFDEIALEEGLKLREKTGSSIFGNVYALSIGPEKAQETLRTALAMGADRAIHVVTSENKELDPIDISRIICRVVQDHPEFGLILFGKQAIDDDSGQVAQIVSGMLNWPQFTYASQTDVEGNQIIVSREVEKGVSTFKAALPAVISTDLRLNTPRYATLQNIMKSKSKPIDKLTLEKLGLTTNCLKKTLSVEEPKKRENTGQIYADSLSLYEAIKKSF